MEEKTFRMIPVENIIPDRYQPRRTFEERDISKLAQSISEIGLIQPITVKYMGEGNYRIISGERRYRACIKTDMKTVPCIILNTTEEDAALMTVTENLHRKELNCFEQAEGIRALMKGLDLSSKDVAKKLGMSPSAVENKLCLLRIPEDVRAYLVENKVGERQIRALLNIKPSECREFAKFIVANKLSSRQTEDTIKKYLKNKRSPINRRRLKPFCEDARLYVNSLNQTLGLIKTSGIANESKKEDLEDRVIYTFVIEKETAI